jgi:hypothetical protein
VNPFWCLGAFDPGEGYFRLEPSGTIIKLAHSNHNQFSKRAQMLTSTFYPQSFCEARTKRAESWSEDLTLNVLSPTASKGPPVYIDSFNCEFYDARPNTVNPDRSSLAISSNSRPGALMTIESLTNFFPKRTISAYSPAERLLHGSCGALRYF